VKKRQSDDRTRTKGRSQLGGSKKKKPSLFEKRTGKKDEASIEHGDGDVSDCPARVADTVFSFCITSSWRAGGQRREISPHTLIAVKKEKQEENDQETTAIATSENNSYLEHAQDAHGRTSNCSSVTSTDGQHHEILR
jgi:hypothetical protein